ncbi:MAG: hypothetical protein M3Y87_20790, partial [Myxococcota bacterium]|nr:hypothetical protein [Myxococcota bacterium]
MCAVPDADDERALFSVAEVTAEVAREAPFHAPVLACLPTPPAYTGHPGLSSLPNAALPASGSRLASARRALASLDAHRSAGRAPDALVALASLRTLVPELADRWDLIEGELRPREQRGCDAFGRALESPNTTIAARARVAHVRC